MTLDSLNDVQRQAVEYSSGPELVIAGAGSGKTRVLTYKIAWLIEQGTRPWQILALTFTNKAASEMTERIAALVGADKARYIYMGTFHSIFARLLRKEAVALGFPSNYVIYDEKDSLSVLKTILRETGLDEKVYKPQTLRSRISSAKNRIVLPEQYAQDADQLRRDSNAGMGELHRVYAAYQQRLRKAGAMDFDDLLLMTYLLFRQHPEVATRYADHFQYVLIDEYQDTNYVQQQIMLQLTARHRRVCVVGDDYQSIYGFRGARIDNILNFQKNFTDARVFKLERNYRSTQNIVNAAGSLMKHNRHQMDKDVYSENDEGERVQYYQLERDRDEATLVADTVKRLMRRERLAYDDFAVLYRTNAQSRAFEEEMRNRGIPYYIYKGTSFYQRKEVKDIIAYLRLVANPQDEEALRRIINYPSRGIGEVTQQRVAEAARQQGVTLWQAVAHPGQYAPEVARGSQARLQGFAALITSLAAAQTEMDAAALARKVVADSGIAADLSAGTDEEAEERRANVDELLNSVQQYVEQRKEQGQDDRVGLDDYLQEVSLVSDTDGGRDSEGKVAMMTVHAAKGLEYNTVFVVGLERDIFPSAKAAASERDMEEERRLLYVAITRAERHCVLSSVGMRWLYGAPQMQQPSPFVREISAQYMETHAAERRGGSFGDAAFGGGRSFGGNSFFGGGKSFGGGKPFGVDSSQRSGLRRMPVRHAAPAAPAQPERHTLQVGTEIDHQRFGRGTVTQVTGTGEDEKATVQFQQVGTKQLLLRFAQFKVVKSK